MIIIFLAVALICAVAGAVMAGHRGRSPIGWFIICFFIGLFGILLLAILGPANRASDAQVAIAHQATLDRRRWETLLEVDPDVAAAAAEARRYGHGFEEALAERYLALGDKSYLAAILEKIKEQAESGVAPPSQETSGRIGPHKFHRKRSGEYVITAGRFVGKTFASYRELEAFARNG